MKKRTIFGICLATLGAFAMTSCTNIPLPEGISTSKDTSTGTTKQTTTTTTTTTKKAEPKKNYKLTFVNSDTNEVISEIGINHGEKITFPDDSLYYSFDDFYNTRSNVNFDTYVFNGDRTIYASTKKLLVIEGIEKDIISSLISSFDEENEAFDIANYEIVYRGIPPQITGISPEYDLISQADIYLGNSRFLNLRIAQGFVDKVPASMKQSLKENIHEGALEAASVGDELYGYPLNYFSGYFMYYDKSVVDPTHVGSLEDILADCEAAGKSFCMELDSSWYASSFLYSAGYRDSFEINTSGEFVGWNRNPSDSWTSAITGLRGMQKVLSSSAYICSSNYTSESNAGALIAGTWAVQEAFNTYGENLGIAELPSYTIDGESYHMSNFVQYNIYTVKPQLKSEDAELYHRLAAYLTNQQSQEYMWSEWVCIPTNKVVQKATENLDMYAAIYNQMSYGIPQPTLHDSWWGNANDLFTAVKDISLNDVVALEAALNTYTEKNKQLLKK